MAVKVMPFTNRALRICLRLSLIVCFKICASLTFSFMVNVEISMLHFHVIPGCVSWSPVAGLDKFTKLIWSEKMLYYFQNVAG